MIENCFQNRSIAICKVSHSFVVRFEDLIHPGYREPKSEIYYIRYIIKLLLNEANQMCFILPWEGSFPFVDKPLVLLRPASRVRPGEGEAPEPKPRHLLTSF